MSERFNMISAEQMLRNAKTKARIISRRELRMFMRGELDVLPCSTDTQEQEIQKLIERLANREGEP